MAPAATAKPPPRTIDQAARTIVQAVSQEAPDIPTDNRDILDRDAEHLPEIETLDETALREVTQHLRRPGWRDLAPAVDSGQEGQPLA